MVFKLVRDFWEVIFETEKATFSKNLSFYEYHVKFEIEIEYLAVVFVSLNLFVQVNKFVIKQTRMDFLKNNDPFFGES